jgi:hypothetical protein
MHEPSNTDPKWLRERYDEAKEILDDLNAYGHAYKLPDDLRERIVEWHTATAFDGCTTLGPDCACNTRYAEAIASTREQKP